MSDLKAEAYIGIGEAQLKLDQPIDALNNFNNAEGENKKANNARIRAVCSLRTAEAYVALKQSTRP